MSIPPTAEKRKKVPRTYDIFEDQIAWLDNSSLNKSKKIRELLDNFIEEIDKTVIENLRDEITVEKKENQTLKEELVIMFQSVKERGEIIKDLREEIQSQEKVFDDSILGYEEQFRELMETIESQKAVIVALGEKQ